MKYKIIRSRASDEFDQMSDMFSGAYRNFISPSTIKKPVLPPTQGGGGSVAVEREGSTSGGGFGVMEGGGVGTGTGSGGGTGSSSGGGIGGLSGTGATTVNPNEQTGGGGTGSGSTGSGGGATGSGSGGGAGGGAGAGAGAQKGAAPVKKCWPVYLISGGIGGVGGYMVSNYYKKNIYGGIAIGIAAGAGLAWVWCNWDTVKAKLTPAKKVETKKEE